MSLPVGTLVLIVRSTTEPRHNGKTGEIAGGLAVRYERNWGVPHVCYLVKIPGVPSTLPSGLWGAAPECVFPIAPPGTPDDVTTDEPRKVTA